VTVFDEGITGRPGGIAAGPDGAVWFTQLREDRIGRLDPETGDVREIDVPGGSGPRSPLFSADGRMWFTGLGDRIGVHDPDSGETRFFSDGITPGSVPHTPADPGDGFLYFTEQAAARLGRVNMATGEIEEIEAPGRHPLHGIVAEEGGRYLWAARQDADQLIRFDVQAQRFDLRAQFSDGSGPHDVRIGPDGMLFATLQHSGRIGVFDPDTQEAFEHETDLPPNGTPDDQPDLKLVDLTVSPDGDAVFASSFSANRIYRLDPDSGEVDQPVCGIPPGGSSLQIIAGPGDRVWYADPLGGRIVRVDRLGSSDQDPVGVPAILPGAAVPSRGVGDA
jgi:streptogramin lyase